MDNAHPVHEQNKAVTAVLSEFIQSNPEARELKRALAVKLALAGEAYAEITELVGLHKSSISKWKQRFVAQGLDGIRLGYQGSKSYLSVEQKAQVIFWLKTQAYWNLDELVNYLDQHYGVIYQSKQSYYELLAAAGISWKKSQKTNPKYDAQLVENKREEIQAFMQAHHAQIEVGDLAVFF